MSADSQAGDPVTSPSSSSNNAKDGSASANSPGLVDASSKKRKAGPGARGVANLTPEQLAKKRANDREAQRNIRERTKAQIEGLERTIEQLKSRQPYQELQRVIREKEAVEAENADIKRRLTAVLELIRPMIGNSLDVPDGNITSQRLALATGAPTNILPPVVPRAGVHHEQFMSPPGDPLSASSTAYTMPWQGAANGSPDAQVPPPFAPRPRSPNGQPTLLGMASSIYRITDSEQEALNLLHLSDGRPGIESRPMNLAPPGSSVLSFPASLGGSPLPGQLPADMSLAAYQRLPYNGPPTCTLDSIVLTFRLDIEKRMKQGQLAVYVLGPNMPDWRYISDPDSPAANQGSVGALSRFFGQVLSNRMFPDLQAPPEKVGSAYLLYTSMYWSFVRDEKSFQRVPEWLRPTDLQLKVAHGPWVDAMFWPAMRDKVLSSQPDYHFDELFVPLTRTVSCNWPHGDDNIFDQVAMRSGQWLLSERFVEHIEKLENWTMGSDFANQYPQLIGTYPAKGQN